MTKQAGVGRVLGTTESVWDPGLSVKSQLEKQHCV